MAKPSPPTQQPLDVLIIEHSQVDVELCLKALEKGGFDVSADVAPTPEAFAELLAADSYDVILADYRLPGWVGMDALAILKQQGKDIPFILITGTLGEEKAVECIKQGATDYLLKDHLDRLPLAARRALEEKALREARQQAEEGLRRSEANYRSLVEGAPIGIFRCTPEGKLLTINPALLEMLGYSSETELLTKNLAIDIYRNPGERAWLREQYPDSVKGVEVEWKRRDGTPIKVRLSSRRVRDLSEAVVYQVIAEDVTEQRTLEERLRQSQKLEAIGQLAGGVAHDFNNLLGVIIGYSDLLLEQLPPTDPQRKKVEQIRKAGNSAVSITRQLLAFGRKQVLEPKVLDLNTVVADMARLLRRLIGEDIDLVIAPSPGLGNVKADPAQMEQVIMNLALNARDAMPRGGKLIIEIANAELDESYIKQRLVVQPGSYVMLAVSDIGVGMDAEIQARIFEPFFTTKEKDKGTGLGLATVYGIVKQSGGYIWVYSEPGKGTTFKIYLPRVETAAEVRPSGEVLKALPRGTETVLLVEDAEPLRELAREFLENSGYTVLEAKDGAEAMQVAERHRGPIHLLLTDVVMPGMSGPELAKRLTFLHPRMKVLYVSGYTNEAISHHGALEEGMALLPKPFTRQVLTRKVREVLGG